MNRLGFLLGIVALLTGPAPVRAGALSLESFFRGQMVATGAVENLRDGTRRPFTIAMTASWAGAAGTLSEEVAYADGEKQHKVWSFTKIGAGRFVGRREDLTRDADVVEDSDGVRMTYKANTRVPSGSTLNLSFEDRLTSLSDDTVSVRSDVSYLFIPAARVTMTISRLRFKERNLQQGTP